MIDKYKLIDYLLLAIFIISFISSAILSWNASRFCISPTSCDVVQSSEYASTFGIKNSHYGVVVFAALAMLTALHIFKPSAEKHSVIKVSVILGSLVAIYFIFLQIFILKAFCTYCIVVDLSLIGGLILVLIHWKGKGWKGS